MAEEYSAIGMLNVDNWLGPDHVEACVAAASTTPAPCDYMVAQRSFRRIDGSIIPILEDGSHVRGVFYSMVCQRDFVVAADAGLNPC